MTIAMGTPIRTPYQEAERGKCTGPGLGNGGGTRLPYFDILRPDTCHLSVGFRHVVVGEPS